MSTTVRVRELGVERLDAVFVPPGLPLVDKGEGNGGTTSILVRGTAGSGKTTLALSLATAIAKHHAGVVLFLTTEFSPAEVLFKAQVLGIPDERVGAWRHRGDDERLSAPGAVLVESLQARAPEEASNPGETRSLAALSQLYDLLHPEVQGTAAARQSNPDTTMAGDATLCRALPRVRAVVLDALTFPGESRDTAATREQLLTLVQALEHEGISSVIVEEAGTGDSGWLSFVVDIVFELCFHEEPDTGELRRKLVCRKSRYSFFDAGPHDRGHWEDKLCVWPSSLRFQEAFGGARVEPLRVAVPAPRQNHWTLLLRGGVVLSLMSAKAGARRAIRGSPGVQVAHVRVGTTTELRFLGVRRLLASDDPYAMAWVGAEVALKAGRNALILEGAEGLLNSSGKRQKLLRALDALRQLGLLVVVHGDAERLESLLASEAQLVWESQWSGRPLTPRAWRSAERWLLPPESVFSRVEPELQRMLDVVQSEHLNCGSHSDLERIASEHRRSMSAFHGFPAVYASELLGVQSYALTGSLGPPEQALLALLSGDDWRAGRQAVLAFNHDRLAPEVALAWQCTSASVSHNRAAVDVLEKQLAASPVVLGSLLRGLGALDELGRAERVIDDVTKRFAADAWLVERLKCEVRLSSTESSAHVEARDRLQRLLETNEVPYLPRAEVIHNLGVVERLLGHEATAQGWERQAREMNPNLGGVAPQPTTEEEIG